VPVPSGVLTNWYFVPFGPLMVPVGIARCGGDVLGSVLVMACVFGCVDSEVVPGLMRRLRYWPPDDQIVYQVVVTELIGQNVQEPDGDRTKPCCVLDSIHAVKSPSPTTHVTPPEEIFCPGLNRVPDMEHPPPDRLST
jgi:hypothetical protein